MKLAAAKLSRQVNTKALLKNQNGKLVNGFSPRNQLKSILFAQPKPENEKNPYAELGRKHKLTIDFKPFIHLEGVAPREFRRLKVNPGDYAAVVFTSRSAVDQYFKLVDELRAKIS